MADFYSIRFERSGGFMGMTLTFEVTHGSLDAADAVHIRKLMDQSGLAGISSRKKPVKQYADQINYKFVIEYHNRKQVILLEESDVPDNMWPLIKYFTDKAKRNRKL